MAEQHGRPKSPRELQLLEKSRSLQGMFASDGMKARIKMALPSHMDAGRLQRIAISACANNPVLYDCTRDSLAMALVRSAEVGLECDGVEGALVPFKKKGILKAQFIPMFQGLAKLAYQSELVLSIQADVVRERDDFKFKRGTQAFVDHYPYSGDGEAGKMEYAYAVAEIKGGGWPFVVLNRAEVMRHRAASPAANSDFSPWSDPATEPAMWKKTAVRELCKLLPRSATLRQALLHEDALELDGEVIDGVVVSSNDADGESGDDGNAHKSRSDELAERLGAGASKHEESEGVPIDRLRSAFECATTEDDINAVWEECQSYGLTADQGKLLNGEREKAYERVASGGKRKQTKLTE